MTQEALPGITIEIEFDEDGDMWVLTDEGHTTIQRGNAYDAIVGAVKHAIDVGSADSGITVVV